MLLTYEHIDDIPFEMSDLALIQSYMDRFSDPDEMNELDKGKFINAFRTLTQAVGDAMGRRRGS